MGTPDPLSVVICGVSARAAATSAARAGFHVVCIDAYGDLDRESSVRAISTPRDYGLPPTPANMARVACSMDSHAIAYLSPFENHPRLVSRLAAERALWGNPPAVLRRVRDPQLLAAVFRRLGFPAPAVRPNGSHDPNAPNDRWLLKPLRSGGGRHVRAWGGQRVPDGFYLQQRVDGIPGSVVFVAAAGKAQPIGISRQLIGDPHFGADGYRYCGNIMTGAADPQFQHGAAVFDTASAMARAVASEFGLVGVNGIDFIARGGEVHPIELNPRWTAALELVEYRSGCSVFAAHVRACRDAIVPQADTPAAAASAIGKAVVFARSEAVAPDTRDWLDDPMIRDIPQPGERFQAGEPVCTVLAGAPDGEGCYRALVAKAEGIYARLNRA